MIFRPSHISFALAVLIATVSGLAMVHAEGFDLSPDQSGRIRAEKSEKVIASIPATFKFVRDDTLTVGISVAHPPLSAYATDAKTVVGYDPDFAQLIADILGRKLELVPVAWADWPLGLESGKFDAVISNVGVTEQRKEKFDFSTYRLGLHGFYVKADSPITSIKEPKDIAGLRIITGSGTIQEKILLEWDKQNAAKGLKPVELQYYDDDAVSALAIQSGRADAEFNPNAPQAYRAAIDHKIKLVGTVNAGWPLIADVAITTRKGSGIADSLTAAINELIADGKYAQSLERWKLSPEALDKSRTNPPGLPKI
ncbi:ABC transporter substrate-binding protein [Phyllobacterium calauticae]|uniref:ABC transporter substrate-binding protein n=1 Tax=Phyllobacterium calauticae TaxID=2817027 RepID=UPI001CBE9672|nr:ABC transporter substrate-binding protein [Phyllobacterium calauticae]MBZ3695935.1 ABC transporter substrate-binding protein [Phyllobacterium calauticae]